MRETFVFTRADVVALLPLRDCIDAVGDAFGQLGRGEVEPPAALAVHSATGAFHVKAGILKRGERRYFATKANGNFPDNPAHFGLPTIQGLIILSDAGDGRVLAVMDSSEITALRTAAATAVAARALAREASTVVAICGCGVQGRVQLRALTEVLPVEQVFVHDALADSAAAFAEEMSHLLQIPVTAARSVKEAVAQADVCVTCTTARQFILQANDVRPGMFIAGVGVDNENKRELAPGVLTAAAKVVTDLRDQCSAIGDLHHAIEAGVLHATDVYADLADVVAGKRAGRESNDEIIVFDSTGLAIQDVAAAAAIYERALTGGITRSIVFG